MLNSLPVISVLDSYILVPTPSANATAVNTHTVGQSLTLQCEVTTVKGITSRVDIVWSSDGTILRRINNVSSTTMDNSLVYTDSYTISQLSTIDDGRVIQCEVVINAAMANDDITLDIIGKTDVASSILFIHTYRIMQIICSGKLSRLQRLIEICWKPFVVVSFMQYLID